MTEASATPIAVIGMGCRLPGGIESPEKLWEALLRGDDLVTEIPADHWDVDEFYDPEPGVPGKSVTRYGGFLDDIWGFDAPFFGLRTHEATYMDPNHRLLMETSWEAIEHAGMDPRSLFGSKTGVFMGIVHDDHVVLTYEAGAIHDAYAYPGNTASMASGRIAYWLGVHGPTMTMDTACSTGLLTLHLACRSLHDGESDLALAGGVNTLLSGIMNAAGSALGMYSPTGHCHSFDAAADGFVRAEGSAVVLLKRLTDAVRDGDRILAVVRGTAANHDGRTKTISRPSLEAQAMAYRAALAAAGVDGATVGMVEAHGTGTRVGDPIEFGSLSQVYGVDGQPCALGSAKSNFGHTEAAAGALGLIKTTLALQHGVVPQSLHFTQLPDEMAKIDTALFVPTEATPWPNRDGLQRRRAAVSSYGLSGTNVHAVLEQAPDAPQHGGVSPAAGSLVFALSATSTDALRQTATRLADWVGNRAEQLAPSDLAYTLARRRGRRPVRAAVVASSIEELTERLGVLADDENAYPPAVGQDDRGPVWVFSGQGSQWAGMGAELLATEPVFAATVAEAEALIAAEAGFSVTQAMSAPETVTGIDRVQPTLFTMQVALAAAMRSHGVAPGAVIGHSLGEAAAAVVCGALSLEDGVRVICRRSRLLSTIAGAGAMASVELPAVRVSEELAARNLLDVVVSVVASPNSTVIGGATQTVSDLVETWERRGVMAREVAVDVASHSPQVDPILGELAHVLADITPMTPTVPYYSATLDDPRAQPSLDAGYWVDNLRNRVRFADAVQAALEDGHRVFAELSPHPLLTRAVEQTAQAADVSAQALASVFREQQLPHGLLEFLANLHCAGAAVDFAHLYPAGRLVDAPLPTWTHRQLRIANDGNGPQALGTRTVAVHPLLGAHVRLPEEPERHAWQGDVGTAALPWLRDHRVHAVPALPGAAYCEMALSAAQTVLGQGAEVRDIRFEQMLLLDEQTPLTTVASVEAPGIVELEVVTDHDGERTRRAVASLHLADDDAAPDSHDIAALLAAHPSRTEGEELRQLFESNGIQLGPAFAGLIAAHTSNDASTLIAEIALPKQLRAQQGAYRIHPVLLDACFQAVAAHPAVADGEGGLLLPLSVRRLRLGAARNPRYCLVRVNPHEGSGLDADLDVLDEAGASVLTVRGLHLGNSAAEGSEAERVLAERLLTIEWQQDDPAVVRDTDPGQWLMISTSDAADDRLTTELVDALKDLDAQCDWFSWPQYADHLTCAGQLDSRLRAGTVNGVVVVCPPPVEDANHDGLARAREQVSHLVRIVREMTESAEEPPRLFVLTRAAQTVESADRANLDQGGLRGLIRVVGAEHPELRPTQIDVDGDCDPDKVALELLSGSDEDETAWRAGRRYVARLRPTPLRPDERRVTTVDHETDNVRLEIRSPGDLETLELVAVDRVPPGPGQIEVAITASSINFADVFVAFGQYPTIDGRPPALGIDFAGVVTAVGPDVTDHQIGDHVGGFSRNGCWASFVTCDARATVTLPPGLTDQVAAAITSAHTTAWYALHDQARIAAGDKVLIHSATGGVGQAAIAIARAAGAEIFATAGSPARRELLRGMGIEYVYDSRSIEFADLIRKDTDGTGVDIVLNSLTGPAQRAGFELLALDGRFVEIGKRDVYTNTRLGLYPFRRNLTFHYLDMALMVDNRSKRLGDNLRHLYRLVANGELPQPEATHYPLAEAANVIRVMSAAQHTGKLVLDAPRGGHSTVVVPPENARIFRPDGSYVITGGLGGLGLFLASEMAAAGCGRIVLTSRSQPDAVAEQTIARIRATGADIHVECGDIADPATAGRLVAAATATGLPVRGVVHAAAVVEDATLTTISDELIERDWVAKVYGAWHMHEATAEQPLDWFCAFSSAAALLGSPGQGAYAAANSWLDAFTHWRRAKGLPATTIAWGAWGQIGRAASLEEGRTTMIAPDEGGHAFQTLLRYDRAYTGYMPTGGTPLFDALVARSPFAEAFKTAGGAKHDTAAVRAELLTLPREDWPTRLRRLVTEQAGLILRRTVDPDHSFQDHGLDSLGFLELRSRIETETGLRLTPKAIATHNTARSLAKHLADALATEQSTP
jgi:acyl transferase domain-containing protein/acyl carrier protein